MPRAGRVMRQVMDWRAAVIAGLLAGLLALLLRILLWVVVTGGSLGTVLSIGGHFAGAG